ncbi:MAG: cytochrome P450 [Actinomadura sp.]
MATPQYQYLPHRSRPFDPPEMLGELRRRPISKVTLWDGSAVWLATRYEDAQFVLQDSRFSSNIANPAFPFLSPGRANAPHLTNSLGFMDDPRHAEIRRMLAGDFLSHRVDELRPAIEQIVQAQVDRLLGYTPPVDLYTAFALPIPSRMIIKLLGIPTIDRRRFEQYTDILVSGDSTQAEFNATLENFYTMCGQLLEDQATESSDGVLARVQREYRAGRLSFDEARMGAVVLITAGHSTTGTAISLGALMMLLDPEMLRAVRGDQESVRTAVEEVLRYHSVTNLGLPRVATEDVPVGDQLISAGDGVVVSVTSANRDESAFTDADTFDVTRSDARRHMAFGHGAHKCLGQWLARAELQIALPALANRIPTLRLAVPREKISFIDDSQLLKVNGLPVTW